MLQASWRVYAAGAVPNRIYLLGLTSARSKLWELRSMPSRTVSVRQLRGRAAYNMFVAGLCIWLFIWPDSRDHGAHADRGAVEMMGGRPGPAARSE